MKSISIFALLATVILTAASAHHAEAKTKKYIVTIENMKFTPNYLPLAKNDTVIFKNNDLVPHTATASDKSFDSGTIEPGKSWPFRAKTPVTILYKCSFHPTMTGTIAIHK